MLTATFLLATFLVAYATGPAGKDDRTARRVRLDFPKAWALTNEFGACGPNFPALEGGYARTEN